MSPRVALTILTLSLAAVLAGCAPEPSASSPASPSRSPAFSSEAEAFAAAEKTYRAYVDALNERRLGQVGTSDPSDFLGGAALRADQDAQRQLDASGLSIAGDTRIDSLTYSESGEGLRRILLAVCLDSSGTRVVDGGGKDVTPQDRPERTLVEVQLRWFDPEFLITDSVSAEASTC